MSSSVDVYGSGLDFLEPSFLVEPAGGVRFDVADRVREFWEVCTGVNGVPVRLWDWQVFALRVALAQNEQGSFVSNRFGLSLGRQQGKSEVMLACGVFLASLGFRVVYSFQHGSTSKDFVSRLHKVFGGGFLEGFTGFPVFDFERNALSNGGGGLVFENGGYLSVRVRGQGGRGFQGVDLVVFDEALDLSEAQFDSYSKTVLASNKRWGALWFVSTPSVDDVRGRLWRQFREGSWLPGFVGGFVEWGVPDLASAVDSDCWVKFIPTVRDEGVGGFSWRQFMVLLGEAEASGGVLGFAREVLNFWGSDAGELGYVFNNRDFWGWRRGVFLPERGDVVRFGLDVEDTGKGLVVCLWAARRRLSGDVFVEVVFEGDMGLFERVGLEFLKARRGVPVFVDDKRVAFFGTVLVDAGVAVVPVGWGLYKTGSGLVVNGLRDKSLVFAWDSQGWLAGVLLGVVWKVRAGERVLVRGDSGSEGCVLGGLIVLLGGLNGVSRGSVGGIRWG